MPFYNYKIFNQELSYTYLYADRALGNLRHAILELEQNFNVRFNGIQNLILFKEEMKKSYFFFEKNMLIMLISFVMTEILIIEMNYRYYE